MINRTRSCVADSRSIIKVEYHTGATGHKVVSYQTHGFFTVLHETLAASKTDFQFLLFLIYNFVRNLLFEIIHYLTPLSYAFQVCKDHLTA